MKDISKDQALITNSQQAAAHLTQAAQKALKVHREKTYAFDPSNDSELNILCGMLCKLPSLKISPLSNWFFICVSSGNNKAFYWSYQNKKIKEITVVEHTSKSFRVELKQEPQTQVYEQLCDDEEKDIIILMNPLMYYNFDPEVLGFTSNQLLSEKETSKRKNSSWSKVSPEQRSKIRLKALEKALQRAPEETASSFVDVVIQNTLNVTTARREYLKENPDQEKFLDSVLYTKMQGKMGQGACVAFRVGQILKQPTTQKIEQRETVTQAMSDTISRETKKRNSVFLPMTPVKGDELNSL